MAEHPTHYRYRTRDWFTRANPQIVASGLYLKYCRYSSASRENKLPLIFIINIANILQQDIIKWLMRTTRSFTESVADPDHWRDIQYDPLRIRLLSSVDNHRHRNQWCVYGFSLVWIQWGLLYLVPGWSEEWRQSVLDNIKVAVSPSNILTVSRTLRGAGDGAGDSVPQRYGSGFDYAMKKISDKNKLLFQIHKV